MNFNRISAITSFIEKKGYTLPVKPSSRALQQASELPTSIENAARRVVSWSELQGKQLEQESQKELLNRFK